VHCLHSDVIFTDERFEGYWLVGITEFADDTETAVGVVEWMMPLFIFVLWHFDTYSAQYQAMYL